jgi:hypothetical protein
MIGLSALPVCAVPLWVVLAIFAGVLLAVCARLAFRRPPQQGGPLTCGQRKMPTRWALWVALAIFAVVLLGMYAWLAFQRRPPSFDGKRVPISIELFTANGIESCLRDWQVIVGSSRLVNGYFRLEVAPECKEVKELTNLHNDTVAIVFDRSSLDVGRSQYLGSDEKYVVTINPDRMNSTTLSHEFLHVLNGDLMIARPWMPHFIGNIILDLWIDVQQSFMDLGFCRLHSS